MTTINTMTINGHKAVISLDPELEMFRGEFVGLNGNADFYGRDIASLMKEGAQSLRTFFEVCAEQGIDPIRSFSGQFRLRIDPHKHEAAAIVAAARGISLNAFVEQAVEHELEAAA